MAGVVVGVVALLNAVNFLDAMDGVVGAAFPIIALGFVLLAIVQGASVDTALGWALIGACAGFLVYNAPPARIFLGDAGSHLLGFVLAALALQALAADVSLPARGIRRDSPRLPALRCSLRRDRPHPSQDVRSTSAAWTTPRTA